ncbi:MAG: 4-hydroxy-tetrahydrodipicolinate reductase [Acidobacteriota bacterium]
MKIALIGYGKMGKLIEAEAARRGHETLLRLSSANNLGGAGLTKEVLAGIDVCIDFSIASAVVEHIKRVVAAGKPIVVGTTGWSNELTAIKDYLVEHGGGLVYGSNFSFGMNVFFRIIREATRLFATSDAYDVFMVEHHHKWKQDAPSGTALVLQSILSQQVPDRPCEIACVRAGHAAGTHEITFDSEADTITLTHMARNRGGFAAGAVAAAEWIVGKQGVYEFQDIIWGQNGKD